MTTPHAPEGGAMELPPDVVAAMVALPLDDHSIDTGAAQESEERLRVAIRAALSAARAEGATAERERLANGASEEDRVMVERVISVAYNDGLCDAKQYARKFYQAERLGEVLLARLAAARGEDAPPSDAQSARQPGDPCDCGAMWAERDRLRTALAAAERAGAERAQAIPADQWREDYGPCLWWKDYLGEAPVVGSPLDSDWAEVNDPDEPFTHFTRIPNPVFPPPGAEVGRG